MADGLYDRSICIVNRRSLSVKKRELTQLSNNAAWYIQLESYYQTEVDQKDKSKVINLFGTSTCFKHPVWAFPFFIIVSLCFWRIYYFITNYPVLARQAPHLKGKAKVW